MAAAEPREGGHVPSFMTQLLLSSVHIPVSRKAPVIMTAVTLLSAVANLDMSPHCPSLADKNNIVNSLLVKWSWGWSLLCLGPAVMLTASLYSGLQWRQVVHHLARLAVAHCIWLSITSAFVVLNSVVGVCSDASGRSRRECVRGRASWRGFDISGHIFLLTYCVYVLTEEVGGLRVDVWGKNNLQLLERVVDKLIVAEELRPHVHNLCSALARGLELFAAALMIVWVVMAMITSLYFHSLLEKLLGGVCGFLAWLLTYRCLYGKAGMPPRPHMNSNHNHRPL